MPSGMAAVAKAASWAPSRESGVKPHRRIEESSRWAWSWLFQAAGTVAATNRYVAEIVRPE